MALREYVRSGRNEGDLLGANLVSRYVSPAVRNSRSGTIQPRTVREAARRHSVAKEMSPMWRHRRRERSCLARRPMLNSTLHQCLSPGDGEAVKCTHKWTGWIAKRQGLDCELSYFSMPVQV